jgi:hypothetical protein
MIPGSVLFRSLTTNIIFNYTLLKMARSSSVRHLSLDVTLSCDNASLTKRS